MPIECTAPSGKPRRLFRRRLAAWLLGAMAGAAAGMAPPQPMPGASGAAAASAASAASAVPAPRARLLADYAHQAWTELQGAPPQIQAITQTTDGWLWLSTPSGLYRFDGLQFERMDSIAGHPLQSSIVLPLHATPDGGLWVGYRFGGASLFKDGKAWHYRVEDGFPAGAAMSFTRAPDGSMWATSSRGLAQLRNGHWHEVGAEAGFAPKPLQVRQVLFDRDATQWVSTAAGVYYRRQGVERFQLAAPTGVELWSLAAGPDGSVWASDGHDANYRLSTSVPPPASARRAELPGSGMWFDRAGTKWVLRETSIERIPPGALPDPRQRMTLDQGMSGNSPQTFHEDRDGTLWIGTPKGLDRLRPNRMVPVPDPLGVAQPGLVADRDGAVWLSDYNSGARLLRADGRQLASSRHGMFMGFTGADGLARMSVADGIWQSNGGAGVLTPLPPALQQYRGEVRALAQDSEGSTWTSFITRGIYLVRDGVWSPAKLRYPQLPETRAMSMLNDRQGALWIGFVNNRIARIAQGKLALFGAQQDLAVGNVQCLYDKRGHLWAAGEAGVAWFDGGRFRPLLTADGRELRGISGLVETASGDLWLHGYAGAFRIPAAQLQAFFRDSSQGVSYERFDASDGLSGTPQPVGPFPSLVEASDGKLWFSGAGGAVWMDPAHIRRNGLAPAVTIRAVSSSGQSYPPHAGALALPQGANNLHIRFSALNLAIPGHTAFRYRLEGVDREWQHAEGRREAFYTNLGPGEYRLQVIAANEDGVWNTEGASLALSIPPSFVQSTGFKVLCALALALLLFLAYRWRLAQMVRSIEARQWERANERERIARALHDTFLQQAQATIVLLQLAMEKVPEQLPARAAMERMIGYIEASLVEGRDEVMALRSSVGRDECLSDALQRFGSSMAEHLPTRFSMQADGDTTALPALVRDELFAIAREAIVNAFRHAGASAITVRLKFRDGLCRLDIGDDGAGLAPDLLASGARPGHWGLVGMRERAVRIGATLDIASGGINCGTTVSLRLVSGGGLRQLAARQLRRVSSWSRADCPE